MKTETLTINYGEPLIIDFYFDPGEEETDLGPDIDIVKIVSAETEEEISFDNSDMEKIKDIIYDKFTTL